MLRSRLRFAACFPALLVAAAVGSAQTVSVPAGVTEDVALSGLNTPIRSAARTYQAYYHQSNFTSVASPVLITSMQFRLALGENSGVAVGGTWPSQDVSFTNYDVQLSRASATVQAAGEFPSATTAFAANQGTNLTTVRSGAMTIPAGSYANAGSQTEPNLYGFTIQFSTPYLYTPGEELVLSLTHTGYTPAAELQPFFASDDYAPNSRDAVSSTAGYNAAVPTGFTAPMFVQFGVAPVPEPAGVLAAAAGCVGVGAWVRRRRTVAAA